MTNDDDQAIAGVLSGNPDEYRKLVERYQQRIFRFARNMIGHEHDAEDVTQEVFCVAFDHLGSFDAKRASMSTWLFTIARNKCINYLKRKPTVNNPVAIVGVAQTTQPNDHARRAFWRQLDQALDALPIEQKSAFILAEIEELPYAEIARIERTTLGTIKSRIHRAKHRLRAAFTTVREEH